MSEFVFEKASWELLLDSLKPGDTLPAMRLLAALEEEDDEMAEEVLESLPARQISLDISALLEGNWSKTQTERLQLEEKLVKQGLFPDHLETLSESDPLRLYMEELAMTPAAGEPQFLADRYAAGDKDAAMQLVNVSMHQVVDTAKTMVGKGVLLLDLIQEGSLGLWQGILAWQGGEDFPAYSQSQIRQAMEKTIVMQARASGVGQRLRSLMEQYGAADKRLLARLGRNPGLEEIAQEMGLSVEDAAVVQQQLQTTRAMAKPEQPEEAEQAVEDTAYFQMRQRIGELLSVLEKQDAEILTLRFGLEGGLPLSPEETGRKLGLTDAEVREREAVALRLLRREE